VQPTNHLTGDASLDQCVITVKSWAYTLTEARQLSDACRAAMIAAGYLLSSERDNDEPGVDPLLYMVTQDYQVWK
jgi:hypothetical protein